MEESAEELFIKLNRETSRIAWHELQRFYAQGAVLQIGPALDLVKTAVAVAQNDSEAVKAWLDAGDVVKVSVDQAELWLASDHSLWAVVVAPWVLVQADKAPQ